MSKSNAYRWFAEEEKAGKVWVNDETPRALELDELFWFSGKRKRHENRVNLYLMTITSRFPR